MHIDHKKPHDYLPHRGINLFIDSVDLDRENKSGVGHAVVPQDDPRTCWVAIWMALPVGGSHFWLSFWRCLASQ